MRMRTLASLLAISLVAVTACGGDAPDAKTPTSAKSAGGGDGKGVKTGDKAPVFSIDSMNGQGKVAVATGKVRIVDFWATWCEPCKKSFPKYQELYAKYKSKGLEVIAFSGDDEKKDIPDFIKTYGAKFPVGWDQGHDIASCWKPATNPTAYIIDKKCVVRHIHNEWHPGDEKTLEDQIKALL